MEWISVNDRMPDVNNGGNKEFIVAMYRQSSNDYYVFSAFYLNKMELETYDDYEIFSGWHLQLNHDNYDEYFEPVCTNGDANLITHWMPLPQPPKDNE